MKKKHRNSQKRIYVQDGIYSITSNTKNWVPFFKDKLFCNIFVENLRLCKKLKGFYLYAWFLGYNHFHLLLRPNDDFNFSKIMKSLKENISCDINQIIQSCEGATSAARLQVGYEYKFQWQKSFHDHIIRGDDDFGEHWEYIKWNPIKHKMPDNWTYIFTNSKYADLIDYIEL